MSTLQVTFRRFHTLVLSFIPTSPTPTHLVTQVVLVTSEETSWNLVYQRGDVIGRILWHILEWPSLGAGQGCSWPQEPLEPGPECGQASAPLTTALLWELTLCCLFFFFSFQVSNAFIFTYFFFEFLNFILFIFLYSRFLLVRICCSFYRIASATNEEWILPIPSPNIPGK